MDKNTDLKTPLSPLAQEPAPEGVRGIGTRYSYAQLRASLNMLATWHRDSGRLVSKILGMPECFRMYITQDAETIEVINAALQSPVLSQDSKDSSEGEEKEGKNV